MHSSTSNYSWFHTEMANTGDNRPGLWLTNLPKNNAIVLADRALFVGTVKPAEFQKLGPALDEGTSPADLLAKCRKVPLRRITRFLHWVSLINPNATLTVYFDDGDGAECKQFINFALPANRDAFVAQLNARLGDWIPIEEERSPVITVIKFASILAGIVVVTAFLCVAYLMGWITSAPWFGAICLNTFGVWGLLGTGALFFLAFLGIGIQNLVKPPSTLTYLPDD